MSSLSVAETDFEVVHADLRDREAQLANLQAALTQLEQDNIQQAENLKLNFQRQLTELHRTHESDIQASKAEVVRRASTELRASEEDLRKARIEVSKMQVLQRQQALDNRVIGFDFLIVCCASGN